VNYRTLTAKILIDIKAVNFNFKKPFTLTSGKKSPVYIDCRKLISFPKERNKILNLAVNYFKKEKINFDILAGGETAGIPYAAFLSEKLNKPMIYIRKKKKDFGKGSQIEGNYKKNKKVILIEDLATDGGSKVVFVDAIRKNNLKIKDTFVIFYYDIFEKSKINLSNLGIKLHCLCTWKDILKVLEKNKVLSKKEFEKIKKYLKELSDNH
tara:strand:+ start:316 stop:945 length:630 start_codon:yes stop_codon:yes gene_type:complete